jgi:hypothetical protein
MLQQVVSTLYTYISQRKLAFTERNTLFALLIIEAPQKFKKWPRPLIRPKTTQTCHQKPNPSRETVPLMFRVYFSAFL